MRAEPLQTMRLGREGVAGTALERGAEVHRMNTTVPRRRHLVPLWNQRARCTTQPRAKLTTVGVNFLRSCLSALSLAKRGGGELGANQEPVGVRPAMQNSLCLRLQGIFKRMSVCSGISLVGFHLKSPGANLVCES